MDRLAPEDIQPIVASVTASNRELILGIVMQLKDSIQSGHPATQEPRRANLPANLDQQASDQTSVGDQQLVPPAGDPRILAASRIMQQRLRVLNKIHHLVSPVYTRATTSIERLVPQYGITVALLFIPYIHLIIRSMVCYPSPYGWSVTG